jgi:hypothetical protein
MGNPFEIHPAEKLMNPFERHPAEAGDKSVRDSKEKEPRVEALEQNGDIGLGDNGQSSAKARIFISPARAHSFGLRLLSVPAAVALLKTLIGEKLVNKEHVTRLDVQAVGSQDIYEAFGGTGEHLSDLGSKNFLLFEVVKDGDELAMAFVKSDGQPALRPLDNEVLASMLNKVVRVFPELLQGSDEETLGESHR